MTAPRDFSHVVGDARKKLIAAEAELQNHAEVHPHVDEWPDMDDN